MADRPGLPAIQEGNAPVPAERLSGVYATIEVNSEFRQSEIISGVREYSYVAALQEVEEQTHQYAVVMSQDCDLLRDYESRSAGQAGEVSNIIMFPAQVAAELRTEMNGGIFKRVVQNDQDRYQYLQAVPGAVDAQGDGVPALVIDFRRHFCIKPAELYGQCATPDGAKRRCRLEVPYREHLQTRAFTYLQRVVLPNPHEKT